MIPDGYGLMFDPEQHAKFVLDNLRQWQEEEDERKRSPPVVPEPVWKDKPAGQYTKR